LRPFRPSRPLR